MKTFLIIACLTGGQLLSAASPSFSPLPLSKSYWKDEAFLKSFNGSYRVNARVEPVVSTAERGLLVSIQPLMADGKREEALKKLTSHATAKSSAAVLFNMGNIQFELGKMKEAGESYQKAIKIHPSFLRAHRNLGFVFARSNDWKQAMPALEEAIRLGDQHGATYGQLAYGRLNAEQYASALQAYRLAQVTEPNSLDWKAGVAQCLQHLQRNEEALALIDEVIRARPDEVSYYLLQGSIQISLQRGDDALANLELVRRIGKLDAENHLLLGTLHLRSANAHLARPVILSALAMEKKPPLQSALNTLDFTTQTQNWKLAQDVSAAIEKSWPEVKDRKLAAQKMRLTALIAIESGSDP
ncbi:MAG: tetratricopeptide repeat protein, partial [Akkermansiaceae bacterium]